MKSLRRTIEELAAECLQEAAVERMGCTALRQDNNAALVCITRANLWQRFGERLQRALEQDA